MTLEQGNYTVNADFGGYIFERGAFGTINRTGDQISLVTTDDNRNADGSFKRNFMIAARDVIRITSAYRTASHNTKIGGSKTSFHVKGMAADIVVDGVDARKVAMYAASINPHGVIWCRCSDSLTQNSSLKMA